MSTQADIDAIQNLYEGWRAAVEGGSIAGYLACLDDNIRMMAPGAPDVHGIRNSEEFLGPVFDGNSYRIFWKIDLFDADYSMGSGDPANASVTRRVLTIMQASEY